MAAAGIDTSNVPDGLALRLEGDLPAWPADWPALPVPLIVLPIVFASFYTATRDVFGLPPDASIDAQHGG